MYLYINKLDEMIKNYIEFKIAIETHAHVSYFSFRRENTVSGCNFLLFLTLSNKKKIYIFYTSVKTYRNRNK